MQDDIIARADELAFDHGPEAIEEGIARVKDSVIERQHVEGQRWLSAIFELVRRARNSTLSLI